MSETKAGAKEAGSSEKEGPVDLDTLFGETKEEKGEAKAGDIPIRSSRRTRFGVSTKVLVVFGLLLVVILAVVLSVVLTRDKADEAEEEEDVAIDFRTGVSLVTHYAINATISSRLTRTVLAINVTNGLNCTSIHGITLQVPLSARVASLKTWSEDDCYAMYGKSEALKDARETFLDTAAQGLPGAYIEERDSFTYSLQVAMPPLKKSSVELVIEQLLRQRVGEVKFQLPLVPTEKVDSVVLDLAILDVDQSPNNGTDMNVTLDLGPSVPVNATPTFHVEFPDARQVDLPQVISGNYRPRQLPENGAFFKDGTCFEHLFLPANLEPMPKNVVILFDVSNYDRLQFLDAKKALKILIDSLDQTDTLMIQPFAGKGTENLWGRNSATQAEKVDAKRFVDKLQQKYNGCNLHEAYLEGLLRAEDAADDTDGAVTVLILVSGSWATSGETRRPKIADDVRQKNHAGKVKLFSLGFRDADLDLLSAIAIMNGGVATPLLEGQVDFVKQMEDFFESEFGKVLLSDVQVTFSKDAQPYGQTQQVFPVLAEGTEIVVRGLLNSSTASSLQAITTATTKDRKQTWTATAIDDPFETETGLENSRCFQSYAHARITQLLQLRDAAELLGDDVVKPVVSLVRPCSSDTKLVDCITKEALELAIDANLVARGLTAMVTVDDGNCLSFGEETEICIDGTRGGYWTQQEDGSTSAPTGHAGGCTTIQVHSIIFDIIMGILWAWFVLTMLV